MGKASLAEKYSILIAIAILILGLSFYLYHIDWWFNHDDEGSYLYAAWRISEGEVPYRDFLTPQLPLFLYWGAFLVKTFGPSALALRYATAVAALLAAFFVYLTAKQVFNYRVALLSLPLFLVHKDVYFVARFFRPEAYMLLFATMGAYTFVLSYRRNQRWGILLSGALFGLATLCKLFGAFPFAGCVLFLLYHALRSRAELRRTVGDALRLMASFAAVSGAVFIGFYLLSPNLFVAVLGHHLMQGREVSHLQVFLKGLKFYWDYFRHNPLFLLLTIPAIAKGLKAKAELRTFFMWQIPTVAAFLFLSRDIEDRHLVYLVPTFSILSASFLESLFDLKPTSITSLLCLSVQRQGSLGGLAKFALGLFLAGIALWPFWRKDLQTAGWEEHDTWILARYIQDHTQVDDYVLSDYPGLNFYAQRRNTYLGAGLSGGATQSGQIKGQDLIKEIEDKNVKMVLINTTGGAHHLIQLLDYGNFRQYVQSHFYLIQEFPLSYQIIEIYHRHDLIPLAPHVNFGDELILTGADLGERMAEAGDLLKIALRWQAQQEMGRDYSLSLRLVDEERHLWGQQDKLLENTFTSHWEGSVEVVARAHTSQWASGEVVIDECSLPVLPGTPPGEYQLELVLYHFETGEELGVLNDNGTLVGTRYPLGKALIKRPVQPPSLTAFGIQHPLAEDLNGELQLLGYNLATEKIWQGDTLHLTLFWRALRQMERDYGLLLQVRGDNGEVWAEDEFPLASATHPTSRWAEGEIIRGQYDLVIGAATPAEEHELVLNVVDQSFDTPAATQDKATGRPLSDESLSLASLQVEGRTRHFEVPDIEHPVQVNLGDCVTLLGYDLAETQVTPGGTLHLTLYWQAQQHMETSYKVFTHLLDAQNRIWGQKDSIPVEDTYPTTSWLPGEIVIDRYEISIKPDTPAGEYLLEVGMYEVTTGERLSVFSPEGARLSENNVLLGKVWVGER
jgi:hypothetical protein